MPKLVAENLSHDDFKAMSSSGGQGPSSSKNARKKNAAAAPVKPSKWGEDIANELRLRLPLYASDWTITTELEFKKIVAATLFAYFTSVLPAVIFGNQLSLDTDGHLSLPEVRRVTEWGE
jgi:hypothetical protein